MGAAEIARTEIPQALGDRTHATLRDGADLDPVATQREALNRLQDLLNHTS